MVLVELTQVDFGRRKRERPGAGEPVPGWRCRRGRVAVSALSGWRAFAGMAHAAWGTGDRGPRPRYLRPGHARFERLSRREQLSHLVVSHRHQHGPELPGAQGAGALCRFV